MCPSECRGTTFYVRTVTLQCRIAEADDARTDLVDRRRDPTTAVLHDDAGCYSLRDGHLRLPGRLCLQGKTN